MFNMDIKTRRVYHDVGNEISVCDNTKTSVIKQTGVRGVWKKDIFRRVFVFLLRCVFTEKKTRKLPLIIYANIY